MLSGGLFHSWYALRVGLYRYTSVIKPPEFRFTCPAVVGMGMREAVSSDAFHRYWVSYTRQTIEHEAYQLEDLKRKPGCSTFLGGSDERLETVSLTRP